MANQHILLRENNIRTIKHDYADRSWAWSPLKYCLKKIFKSKPTDSRITKALCLYTPVFNRKH